MNNENYESPATPRYIKQVIEKSHVATSKALKNRWSRRSPASRNEIDPTTVTAEMLHFKAMNMFIFTSKTWCLLRPWSMWSYDETLSKNCTNNFKSAANLRGLPNMLQPPISTQTARAILGVEPAKLGGVPTKKGFVLHWFLLSMLRQTIKMTPKQQMSEWLIQWG